MSVVVIYGNRHEHTTTSMQYDRAAGTAQEETMSDTTTTTAPAVSPAILADIDNKPDSRRIWDRAVCINISFERFGTTKKVNGALVEVDADKELIRTSKTLLQCDQLKAICQLDTSARGYLKSRCLPSPFRSGIYLLPVDLLQEVEYRLRAFKTEREGLVSEFAAAYELLVEDARTRLRALFDDSDYPSTDALARSFGMSWNYVTFGVPGQLRRISKELFARESAKAAAQWTEALSDVQRLLRVSMTELVDHMVDRLTPDKRGKRKVFRDSIVGNVRDFLSVFDARNITDDTELRALVERARGLLTNVNAADLRKSNDVRSAVRDGFAAIRDQLDTMVTDRPIRPITFEDE